MSEIIVRLQSNLNISFDHSIETGIDSEEWTEMSEKERQQVIEDVVWEHVEAWVEEED